MDSIYACICTLHSVYSSPENQYDDTTHCACIYTLDSLLTLRDKVIIVTLHAHRAGTDTMDSIYACIRTLHSIYSSLENQYDHTTHCACIYSLVPVHTLRDNVIIVTLLSMQA